NEEPDSCAVGGGKDQAKENEAEAYKNDEDQDFHPQTQIGVESTSLKHAVNEDRDSSNRDPQSQSDAQVPGDDQQGMDEGNTKETQDPDLLTSGSKR
ncbi:hypothetical protein FRC01_012712, partial [Tulasnella sp. 417]